MSQSFDESVRAALARSLPLVHQHEAEIRSRMEANLASVSGQDEPFGHPELTARSLTDLLVRQAEAIVETGTVRELEFAAREHRTLGIVGRHYSRFGDAIIPILKDVIGTPHEIGAIWCDTFWAVINAMQPHRELVEA